MSDQKKIYDTTIYLKGGQTIEAAFHKFDIERNSVKKMVSWESVEGEEVLMTLDPDEIAAVTYTVRR